VAVRIKNITFDCADPYRLAQFWLQLTGFSEDRGNGNAPGDPEAVLVSPDGSVALLFIAVPEPKQVKNRVHLDLVPLSRADATRKSTWPSASVPGWSTTSAGRTAADGRFCPTQRATSSALNAVTPNVRLWSNNSAVHLTRSLA
jgi:hypothetical protein